MTKSTKINAAEQYLRHYDPCIVSLIRHYRMQKRKKRTTVSTRKQKEKRGRDEQTKSMDI